MSGKAATLGSIVLRLAMERAHDGLTRTGVAIPNIGDDVARRNGSQSADVCKLGFECPAPATGSLVVWISRIGLSDS